MPKLGHSRRTTRNADGDRWRRRAEAYERLVYMIRRSVNYLSPDGDSKYGPVHPMRELHEALLILDKYKVVEINKGLKGTDELTLWQAIEQWKKSADSVDAIDRAAEQLNEVRKAKAELQASDPWSFDQAKERNGDDWPPSINDPYACNCGVYKRLTGEHGENPIHAVDCAVHDRPDPTDYDI